MMIDTSPEAAGCDIQTERLRLRLHRLTDLTVRAAMTADSMTMRFVGGPQNGEDNFNRLLRYAGQWALLGRGLFAIEESASGELVGEAGLADFHRDLGADFDGFPEAAWMIARRAAGQGYATEAVLAITRWYERAFGVGRAVCIIDPDNIASLRVAAKLGFTPFREALYKGRTVILHERVPAPPQAG
jgi:RimJ/RimL family protein N-acetyltransferase